MTIPNIPITPDIPALKLAVIADSSIVVETIRFLTDIIRFIF